MSKDMFCPRTLDFKIHFHWKKMIVVKLHGRWQPPPLRRPKVNNIHLFFAPYI